MYACVVLINDTIYLILLSWAFETAMKREKKTYLKNFIGKLILFYLYSWHIFIIKRCFTFQYKCTYNLILHNKSSPDLQLGTIEKKNPKKLFWFDFSQRQTNVFSLSRQATDRQMFKETNGDFSDSITFYWYE